MDPIIVLSSHRFYPSIISFSLKPANSSAMGVPDGGVAGPCLGHLTRPLSRAQGQRCAENPERD